MGGSKKEGLEGLGRGRGSRTGGQGFQAAAGTRLRRAGLLWGWVWVGRKTCRRGNVHPGAPNVLPQSSPAAETCEWMKPAETEKEPDETG